MESTNTTGLLSMCDLLNPSSMIGDSNWTRGKPRLFLMAARSSGNCDVVCILTNSSLVLIRSCSMYICLDGRTDELPL
uniref:Uncharacterized protein n=1 Tax=Amphimedon queenslandica TaxID=400682 RepID=A0A1X7TN79_AMPQE